MVHVQGLLLLAILAGFSHHGEYSGQTLAQAYQDVAHYFLPPNIYDNLPPGIQTPASINTPPPTSTATASTITTAVTTTTTATAPASLRTSPVKAASSSPDESMPSSAANISLLPLIEITTPLLNSVYTPGSTLIMTWTNVDALFPEDWSPPQSILDAIAQDNPSLPYDEKVSLAKTQVQTLKRSQLATAIKDSPIWLKDLRLVSWPFQKSVDLLEIGAFSDHTGDEHDSENPDSPHLWGMWPDRAAREMQQPSSATPPSALFDSGFSLQDLAKLTILGTAGGQLSWIIPEDWEYEGEFEIRIPSVFKGADELAGSNKDEPHMAASHSFWILRDAATRDHSPQYNVPSVDQLKYGTSFMPDRNEPEGSTVALLKKNIKQQRDLGIFLGVAAMMLALVLLGLGAFIGIYRRKWVKSLAASTSAASDGDSDPSAEYTYTHMGSMPSPTKGTKPLIQFSTRPADPLQPARGDDDAHSPTNLGDSEDTLHGSAQSTEYLPFSEKAVMNVQQRN